MNPHHSAPFAPFGTLTQAATTSSAGAALPRAKDQTCVIYNATAGIAFCKVGAGAQTATAADYPVPAGGHRTIQLRESDTHAAVILSTGTGNVYFSVGDGSIAT